MLNKKLSLSLCVSAAALAFAGVAQAAPGELDGAYANLAESITDQEEVADAQQVVVTEALDDVATAQAAQAAALAALTADDIAALDALTAANTAASATDDAFEAATDAALEAQAARVAAQADLGEVQDALVEANTAKALAQTAADAAQEDYTAILADADALPGEVAVALAGLNEANAELDAAEAAYTAVAAEVSAAASAVVAADTAFAAAAAAAAAAETANEDAVAAVLAAQTVLQDSLAANTDLADVFADLELTVDAGDEAIALAGLTTAVTDAEEAASLAQDDLATATGALAGLNRQDAILTDAAESTQENIALASGALTGDLAAANSNFETEVLGALTDHEDRITANTADIATLEIGLVAEAALRVSGDAATLASANTYTDTAVATEAAARVAADTELGGRITTESNARIAADLAETNARIAGDNALGSRITNETNARIAADNVLRDQIASSTATAIALGGNAILPDVNFTLAGNMGFYNGATAVSINAAGKVSSNVYLTAAVGGGLNKQGKVGGRVGVVFGF